MKINKMKDERILQMTNKILSEAYLVVIFLLVASVLIKTYVMNMNITNYIAELGIIVLALAYIVIRSMFAGVRVMNTSKRGKVLTISVALILSFVVSITNGIKNYSIYGDLYTGVFDVHFIAVLAFTFISSLVLITAALLLIYWLNRKGEKRIEKKINADNE